MLSVNECYNILYQHCNFPTLSLPISQISHCAAFFTPIDNHNEKNWKKLLLNINLWTMYRNKIPIIIQHKSQAIIFPTNLIMNVKKGIKLILPKKYSITHHKATKK